MQSFLDSAATMGRLLRLGYTCIIRYWACFVKEFAQVSTISENSVYGQPHGFRQEYNRGTQDGRGGSVVPGDQGP